MIPQQIHRAEDFERVLDQRIRLYYCGYNGRQLIAVGRFRGITKMPPHAATVQGWSAHFDGFTTIVDFDVTHRYYYEAEGVPD